MGNIGESKAVYEFVKQGIDVFLPVNEFQKADLVIRVKNTFYSIQVKTTKSKAPSGNYIAQLKTTGKNSNTSSISSRVEGDYDFLFVLTDTEDFYLIPEKILPKANITLSDKYSKYKNNINIVKEDRRMNMREGLGG